MEIAKGMRSMGSYENILEVRNNDRLLEDFIGMNEAFILKTASKTSRRFISKSDDEWSIALLAFMEAIERYVSDKGNFFAYAGSIIKSRLIDWFRKNGRQSADLHIDDMVYEQEDVGVNDDLRLEIHTLEESLQDYEISFIDIEDNSPKAGKTRESCKEALKYLLDNPILAAETRRTGMLPMKLIEKNSKLSRKLIERHRKYIVAAIVILTGDYPYLSEYFRYVREDDGI